MPGAAVLAVQHLKISNLIYLGFFFFSFFFKRVFFYIYWPKTCVQYFIMLNPVYCNPFACFEAGLVFNCFICA